MKKIIYGCLLALIAISFGCEKDEVLIEEQSEALIDEVQYQSRQGNNNTGSGHLKAATFLNEIPLGTETVVIYLNMDSLETEYLSFPNNPPINGSFNIFYRNKWLTSFTIYTIAYSSTNCDENKEKWTVNKTEYENFSLLQGIGGVNSSAVRPRPVPLSMPDEDEPIISVINYFSCF